MTVGFKTGPRNFTEGQALVADDGFDMCEIWFRVDRADDYREMFAWLTARSVRIGLHHWGVCGGEITPNISTDRKDIRDESLAQIKTAIDIGAEQGCVYVNAHPGSQQLVTMTFTPMMFAPLGEAETEKSEAEKLTREALQELSDYAQARGVTLTLETLPRTAWYDEHDLTRVFNPGFIQPEVVAAITAEYGSMANDITHTSSSFPRDIAARGELWPYLLDFTKRTAAQTKLLHINTTREPFIGTDTHDGVRPEDFDSGVFPNREQVLELLSLFKDRDDVFAVPEPREHMRENAIALRELAKSII